MSTPRMDLAEFRDLGLLQEVNRQSFHPLGLAMFVEFDDDGDPVSLGVFDDRADPEGWYFAARNEDDLADYRAKADSVRQMIEERADARFAALGFYVQLVSEIRVKPGAES